VTVLGPSAAGWRFAGAELRGGAAPTADSAATHHRQLCASHDVGEITGSLTRADRTPVATAGIVVFATDRGAWVQDPLNPRQPRLEQSQRGGRFTISGLLPGEYFVAALEDADMPDLPDVAFLDAVSRIATRVRVTSRARQDVALTIRRVKR
jgi:hypothetical protein